MISKKKKIKLIAHFFLLDMFIGIILPSTSSIYALTSGPSSPEFSSFEPVTTTNMVDPSTGNFIYNLPVIQIPGPDGGGYALSLSYHSGTSSEEESSWVGHGWTLNPGAINTGIRGVPDSYGAPVDVYNKNRPNWTMTGQTKTNLEFFSVSKEKKGEETKVTKKDLFSAGITNNIRFNNYQGLSRVAGFRLAKGFGSLSMNRSATGVTFSATLNPYDLFSGRKRHEREYILRNKDKNKKSESDEKNKNEKQDDDKKKVEFRFNPPSFNPQDYASSLFQIQTYTDVGQNISLSKLRGMNVNISFGGQLNPSITPVGIEGGLLGGFSFNNSEPFQRVVRSDYFTEKANPFDRKDYLLGIPFWTPDNHSLSGEGLSGGFRLFANGPQKFNVPSIKNSINTYGMGLETMIGANIGIGVNLSFGNATSEMKTIPTFNRSGSVDFNSELDYRFYGDLGGKVDFADNSVAFVNLEANPDFPGLRNVSDTFNVPAFKKDNVEAVNTSSLIERKSNGGFSITSENGSLYNYTIPVRVKNATNLAFGINPDRDMVKKNSLAFTNTSIGSDYTVNTANHKRVQGEVLKQPYENTSLLRSITTSDYFDTNSNGEPDDADFGGWTSFEYFKKYGESSDTNKWYRWRMPYTGLQYNKSSISDTKDDTGSVNTGEKEVNYLKKVVTKTHVAYFVTNKSTAQRFGVTGAGAQYLNGTGTTRLDGLSAPEITGDNDPSSSNEMAKGSLDLEYLEKIVLFAKARPELPLQITNFKYDYSLIQNLPNNTNGKYPRNKTTANSGKLTLKKVWSEFEGVYDARISSYKFGYQYTQNHRLSTNYSLESQNPDYSPYLLDAWGNNQFEVPGNPNSATSRHLNLITWPYQGDINEEEFDPAAWQLKRITLPSGGDILVEYESKDYLYVQDRDVMGMVSLKSPSTDAYGNTTYNLNLEDIGGYSDGLCEKINKYFGMRPATGTDNTLSDEDELARRRIYFKMLYALEGTNASIDNCRSEYITGFAKIANISCDGEGIAITLNGAKGSGGKDSELTGFADGTKIVDENYKLVPRQACYDFYVTQRWGKYTAGCESKYEREIDPEIQNLGTGFDDALKALGFARDGIDAVLSDRDAKSFPKKSSICVRLMPELSFFKIPINKAKRGGGIRVKKVLMYDKGIEAGDEATYGNEYKYELEDGRSSGVATNEPLGMREENPLVEFLPKQNQNWLSRLVSGRNLEQSEGPVGESILPSASVTHSRVIIENIHKGKTGTGYTIHEFFTCKDYPYDKLYDYQLEQSQGRQFDFAFAEPRKGVSFTNLADDSYQDRLHLPVPFFTFSKENTWASQGFMFIQNSMHGLPKSVRTYGGTYRSGDRSFISSGQDFEYFEPGEKIPLVNSFDGISSGTYEYDVPGKEVDVTYDAYSITNRNLDFNLEIDADLGISLFPPVFVSFGLNFNFLNQRFEKYATSKIIKYPAIQKKVTSYSDNIATVSENLAFDKATGRPMLTKVLDSYDGIQLREGEIEKHDGSIYSLTIPAHLNYSGMSQKSKNNSNTNQLLASSGQIVTYGKDANPLNVNEGQELTWNIKADKVISANASTYNTLNGVSQWLNDNESIRNRYGTLGSDNVFRMHESYSYKEDVSESSNRNTDLGKIYNAGIVKEYIPFNYKNSTNDERWVRVSEVTKYNPNGNVAEERDVLGVYSAARFDYNFTLPTFIAKNSTFDEIYFEHFEDKINTEPNLQLGVAHSGIYSREITSGATIVKGLKARELLSNTGGWLKFWLKSENDLDNLKAGLVGSSVEITPEFMGQSGEWSLYRAFYEPNNFAIGQDVELALNFNNTSVFIDDIKFNPKEAKTTAYVYDVKSLRLLATFDDQHFGLFYVYDNEGQLIRKLIETERGTKVITETQYNLPRELRD